MSRFSQIFVAYFIIGALLWGGGAINYDNAGVVQYFMHKDANGVSVNDQATSDVQNLGGPIQQAASTLGGGALLALWNLVSKFIGSLFWPVIVLISADAPPRITLMVGGPLVATFLMGIVRLFKSSA